MTVKRPTDSCKSYKENPKAMKISKIESKKCLMK
jgi:hypothetical protein